MQQEDWSRTQPEPFTVGALLATAALSLQAVVKTTQRARLPPASAKCKKCKAGGGELLACSFCTAVYHNTDACLGEAKLDESLAKSASFLWACPACWKKAAVSIQKVALKPTTQPAAGTQRHQGHSQMAEAVSLFGALKFEI